jgi:SH3-like domain-containing protein
MRAIDPHVLASRCAIRERLGACLLAVALTAATHVSTLVSTHVSAQPGGDGGLRYVSLKADKVYLRKGPGTGYPIARVYERAGLPVEVIRQFDVWRQVRDAAGTVGWVHSALLSGRRTALVLPWEIKEGAPAASQPPAQAALREDDKADAPVVAQLAAGALVDIVGCDNGWCRVSAGGGRGYVEQTKLWGTYPNETVR